MNGIDVSKHNGVIGLNAVRQSGDVDFAILRAGYGKSISQKDAQFEANYKGVKAQGILVGRIGIPTSSAVLVRKMGFLQFN